MKPKEIHSCVIFTPVTKEQQIIFSCDDYDFMEKFNDVLQDFFTNYNGKIQLGN